MTGGLQGHRRFAAEMAPLDFAGPDLFEVNILDDEEGLALPLSLDETYRAACTARRIESR